MKNIDEIKVSSAIPKSLLIRFFEIIIVATIYYVTARLGQKLAIPPGNITPVWIPSGVMLAAVLIRGYHIWPGIFLGAFVGNVWAYIDFTSFSIILKCFFTGSANGIGDVLSTAGAAYIIEKTTGTKNPFTRSNHIIKFIVFGVIAGPAISAVFGVTSLCIAGIIQWSNYLYTLITWWTGDGVGALVIAPALIAWFLNVKEESWKTHIFESTLFWIILIIISAYCLQLIPIKMIFHLPMFSLAPILIWSSFRLGQRVTFSAVFFISSITILVTASGHGPFSGKALNVSLTELQWFVAVMSITIFILDGVIIELFSSMNSLQEAHDELELRVTKRTATLVDTNEKLEQEITERKLVEERLKESEEKSRLWLEHSPVCTKIVDLDFNLQYMSASGVRDLKINDIAEHYGKPYPFYFYPDSFKIPMRENLKKAKNTGEIITQEASVVDIEGNELWFHSTIVPVIDQNKGLDYILVVSMEISKRKLVEKKLKKSEASLRDAQRIASIGNWSLDLQTGTVEMSDEMLILIGLKDKNEALNVSNHEKFYTPESWQRFNEAVKTVRNNGKNYEIELEFSDKNAKCHNALARGEAIYSKNNKIIGLKGTLQDITERRLTEKKLQKNESRLKRAEKIGKIGNWEYDLLNYSIVWSDNLFTLYERDPKLGPPSDDEVSKYYSVEDHKRLRSYIQQIMETGEPIEGFECPVKIPSGRAIVSGSMFPIMDGEEKITKIFGVLQDITERKQAEKEQKRLKDKLQQVQKMESIGNLAGGIAHDFNNILYPILGFTQMSMDELPKNHPVQENLLDVLDGAKRARDLVKRILLFSRQKEQALKPIPLKPIIEESLKLLRSSFPSNIEIQTQYYSETDNVLCDETEIHEIIMNLCTNAYQAMEDMNGIIQIILDKEKPPSDISLPIGEYLRLSISDNGPGIKPEVIQNIFEPYFTTKEVGKGSGLGLSVVHGIVKNYKGEIQVENHHGKGTTFHIYLPITSKSIENGNNQEKIHHNVGIEKILFVDDEKSIVKLGTKSLERLGYRVTGMLDSSEALKLVKSNPEEFDLVITDMAMPEMVGTQLAKKILEIRPAMPIILCSGFSEKLEREKIKLLNIKAFIDKPILINDLTTKVREILDEGKKLS